MNRSRDPWPWLLGAAAGLFYLAFHSTFYNFDGVACAIAVELGDLPHLAHGNHLAYGLAGLVFDRGWRVLGYEGPAMLPLQTLDSLLGGAGIGLFFRFLRRQGLSWPAALLSALGLAVSQAYWFWSLEAQVYLFGVFFALLAADYAFAERPSPVPAGIWLAAAVLGHVGHLMLFPVAAYALWRCDRTGRFALRFAAALGLSVAAAYTAAGMFIIRPDDWPALRAWLLGSAALSLDRSFLWYGGYSLENLRVWALMTLRIFAEGAALSGWTAAAAWTLGAAALSAAAAGAARGGHRRLAILAGLWLGGYALLFILWQPWTVVYRVVDLLPLWLLIALWADDARPRLAMVGAWVLAAGTLNATTLILPACDPTKNKPLQEAVWLAQATPPEAWIVVSAHGQVYVPYFSHRRPVNLRYHADDESLGRRLDKLEQAGEQVYVTAATLDGAGRRAFFTAYGLREESRRGEEALYRVMKGKPSGSSQKRLKTAAALRNGPKGMGSERLSVPRAIKKTP